MIKNSFLKHKLIRPFSRMESIQHKHELMWHSESYEKYRPRYPPHFIARFKELLGDTGLTLSSSSHLDVATGTGQFLHPFAELFGSQVGVDVSTK